QGHTFVGADGDEIRPRLGVIVPLQPDGTPMVAGWVIRTHAAPPAGNVRQTPPVTSCARSSTPAAASGTVPARRAHTPPPPQSADPPPATHAQWHSARQAGGGGWVHLLPFEK